ncbi:MAG: flavodoxin family protein [Promethearchaeota archaeon]
MKKILAIMGSPRKNGNTHLILSRILDEAIKKGSEGEILFLGDLSIKECDGCLACWNGNDCSKNDDMNDIYEKISNNNIFLFGTPVYWYGPTALMKAFLDRFVYFNCPENRKKISGKSAILVVPFEEESPDTAVPLIVMFEKSFKYLEMNLIDKLIVPGVYNKGDVLKKEDILDQATKIGRKLV